MANKKQEDKHGKVSPEIREALKKNDIEKLARASKTMQIEGDLPYSRRVYVDGVKFYMQRTAEGIVEAGKRLLVIKEKEGYGEFVKVLEEEIGIPHTTAYRFMNAALKAEKYPTLASSFPKLGNLSNVYTLLEAPEEDLKELESKGVLAGNTIDELHRMSVKEMRDLIKKLKNETEKVVKAEVKNIETEKKALIKEVERLKAFDPEGKDASWCVGQMQLIDELADEFDTALRRFMKDSRILDHPELQAKVEAIQTRVEKRFKLFVSDWDAYVNGEAQ
ncbi:MAG: hypothetical protein QY316_00670 [Thermodesulfobacteriota bacterium]|nr:MAG: hypothetical protein QY316_00670 [Thermodesulfobacteriota bacterium]